MRAKIIKKLPATVSGIQLGHGSLSAALAACLVTVVAGCGKPPEIVHGKTFHLTLSDYSISPSNIQAPPGQYTVIVRNLGQRTHDVVVTLNGIQVGATVKPLFPGQKSSFPLTLVPGTYRLASAILNDQALGQYGSLYVR
jgi:hypothetical protein